jgi:hypothetical protein
MAIPDQGRNNDGADPAQATMWTIFSPAALLSAKLL